MNKKIYKLYVQQHDPKKLGHFLFKRGFSKRAIKNAQHHGGRVFVNHKSRNSAYTLQTGDEVLFVMGQERANHWLKPAFGPLQIVAEKDDWLLLNKPAGLLTIPSRYEDADSLVNRLLGYFAGRGDDAALVKPHVITRLDRDTSGLVLVAKNAVAAARLSALDKQHFVKKYLAIVHGNFASEETHGLIDLPIGKTSSSVKRSVTSQGQKSLTAYRVLQQTTKASLVKIRLLTGRTHQIRVHFSYLGHPLFGDHLYGSQDNFPRQALNCYYLNFQDQGQEEKFQITNPQDIQQLWQDLSKGQ